MKQSEVDASESLRDVVVALEETQVRAVVLGDLMLDSYIWGSCTRISPEAPVPIVKVERESRCLGGAGNVIANLNGLGVQAIPVACTAADEDGEEILSLLRAIGLNTESVICNRAMTTTSKTRVMAREQQIVRIDRETPLAMDAETEGLLIEAVRRALSLCDVLVISDYAKGVCSPKVTRQAIVDATALGIPVVVDPKRADLSVYAGATWITPNMSEFAAAAGLMVDELLDAKVLETAAQALRHRLRVQHLLITRGAQGMTLVDELGAMQVAAHAREVYDISGAGDTVIATLSVLVGQGLEPGVCVRLANLAAGVVVQKVGTTPIDLAMLKAAVLGAGSERKVLDRALLLQRAEAWRQSGCRIVMTNGCFDLLHVGHAQMLEDAASLGDVLVVAVNSDASVRRLKGPERPILTEGDRVRMLAALACVDAVVVFGEETPIPLLRQLQPDVLVKGGDYGLAQVVGREVVEGYGGEVHVVPERPRHSTTRLIESIRGGKTA